MKETQELKLSFRNWQWIIVNDGSTDDIQPILKRITQADSVRVFYLILPIEEKCYAVRQDVLQSHGRILMLLDGNRDISSDLKNMSKGVSIGIIFRTVNVNLYTFDAKLLTPLF